MNNNNQYDWETTPSIESAEVLNIIMIRAFLDSKPYKHFLLDTKETGVLTVSAHYFDGLRIKAGDFVSLFCDNRVEVISDTVSWKRPNFTALKVPKPKRAKP